MQVGISKVLVGRVFHAEHELQADQQVAVGVSIERVGISPRIVARSASDVFFLNVAQAVVVIIVVADSTLGVAIVVCLVSCMDCNSMGDSVRLKCISSPVRCTAIIKIVRAA